MATLTITRKAPRSMGSSLQAFKIRQALTVSGVEDAASMDIESWIDDSLTYRENLENVMAETQSYLGAAANKDRLARWAFEEKQQMTEETPISSEPFAMAQPKPQTHPVVTVGPSSVEVVALRPFNPPSLKAYPVFTGEETPRTLWPIAPKILTPIAPRRAPMQPFGQTLKGLRGIGHSIRRANQTTRLGVAR